MYTTDSRVRSLLSDNLSKEDRVLVPAKQQPRETAAGNHTAAALGKRT
jgi:hypothetical protein